MEDLKALCTACHVNMHGSRYWKFKHGTIKKKKPLKPGDPVRPLGRRPTMRERREYFRSFHWRWLRSMLFQRARGACERCGRKCNLEHVVHLSYANFRDEKFQDLEAVCRVCFRVQVESEKRYPKGVQPRVWRPAPNWAPMKKEAQSSLEKSTKRISEKGKRYKFEDFLTQPIEKPAKQKKAFKVSKPRIRSSDSPVRVEAPVTPPEPSWKYRASEEWAEKKEAILERSGHLCEYCGEPATECKLESGDPRTASVEEFTALCVTCLVTGKKERVKGRRRKVSAQAVPVTS